MQTPAERGGSAGTRLFRNHPAASTAALLAACGIIGLVGQLRFSLSLPAHGSLDPRPPLVGLFPPLLLLAGAWFLFCFLKETTVDGTKRTVSSTFLFVVPHIARYVMSETEAPAASLTGVGIYHVFRGPVRIYLLEREKRTHVATFLMQERKAREFARALALSLQVPVTEIGWAGTG